MTAAGTSLWRWQVIRYGVAVAAVGLGLAVRLVLSALGAPQLPTYVTFYPAVMIVALLCGVRAGMLATAVTAVVAVFWVIPRVGRFAIESRSEAVGLALFSGMGVFMSLVADLYRRARQRAAAYEKELAVRESQAVLNEALRRTADDLARSNRDLEQFAYVSSHDLQEPLRMVTGFMQLFEEKYHGQLDATGEQYIRFAVDGAKRMQRLIEDLLTYSRVGRPGGEGEGPEYVDAGQALAEALSNLAASIAESQAEITFGRLPTVRANESELVQVFQNLIGNAIKFRSERPPRIHVDARPASTGDAWEFSVQDNGIGIDPEYKDKIFVIFQRLHTKEKYPGTGIGLAICRKIVDRHGGRIWVESATGQGATFRFTLPGCQTA